MPLISVVIGFNMDVLVNANAFGGGKSSFKSIRVAEISMSHGFCRQASADLPELHMLEWLGTQMKEMVEKQGVYAWVGCSQHASHNLWSLDGRLEWSCQS